MVKPEDFSYRGTLRVERIAGLRSGQDGCASALGLDNASACAHNALASALFWHDWNWTEAERHFNRAIARNPSLALDRP